jgi:hypothetical protein
MNIWDPVARKYRKVHPVLVLAQADTPFRAIWALLCGHSSRSGCDKCFIRGTMKGPGGEKWGATRFGGYTSPAPTLTFDDQHNWSEGSVRFGQARFDPSVAKGLMVSHDKHLMRCRAADAATTRAILQFPIPAAACQGGDLTADPSSADQRELTSGAPGLITSSKHAQLSVRKYSCTEAHNTTVPEARVGMRHF